MVMGTVYTAMGEPSTDEELDYPVEIIVTTWPAARQYIERLIPPGQGVWEGTAAAWFAEPAPHCAPFSVLIIGADHLALYCRSVGGQLGAPVAIARVRPVVSLYGRAA
jgi:hypothetical protein